MMNFLIYTQVVNLDCSDCVQIMCKCLCQHFSVSCSNLSSVDPIVCCFDLLLFDKLQTETGSGRSPHSWRREAADVGADYERNKWNCNWIRKKIRWGFFSLAVLLIIIRDSLSFHAWSVLLCTLDVERERYSPKTKCSAINKNWRNLKIVKVLESALKYSSSIPFTSCSFSYPSNCCQFRVFS